MDSRTDQELLREYAGGGSEAAFSELVQRYLDFVYSAALRLVGNSQLAEDVSQRVFLALAQNAGRIMDRVALCGWLHGTAHNLSANVVRSEVRRRAREQEAAAMNELLAPESETAWESVAPHLDAALNQLSGPDRDALLLIVAVLGTGIYQHQQTRLLRKQVQTWQEQQRLTVRNGSSPRIMRLPPSRSSRTTQRSALGVTKRFTFLPATHREKRR